MKSIRLNAVKKVLAYAALLGVFFLNAGAGCSGKSDDPQPDNFQTLLGKWRLERVDNEGTKHNGTELIRTSKVRENGGVYVYEFFSDGRLRATGDGKSRDLRWELNVTRLSGKDIDIGTLKLIGDEERKLAQSIGQSGELTFNITTSDLGGANFAIMHLSLDATKLEEEEYKKIILTYIYHSIN